MALLVFILHVRCTAIDLADLGIKLKFNKGTNKFDIKHGLSVRDLPRKFDEFGSGLHSFPSTVSRCFAATPNSSKKGSVGDTGTLDALAQSATRKSCCIEGIFCAVFVLKIVASSLVRKFSKHRRSCDKCVDGFDHHCRWLNNCVGHKNCHIRLSHGHQCTLASYGS